MIVHYMATYYSQWAHENLAQRSQAQWYSFKFCRAVKSKRLNGSLVFPWLNGPEVINEQTIGRARAIFGMFIEHAIGDSGILNPILVPVPSKDGLFGAAQFRSLAMLQEAVAAVPNQNWQIAPALRFNEVLQPAHAGGPRGREALRPYLNVVAPLSEGPIILVDDIVTTGGSLLASYDALNAVGRAPVAAIVCGHTVSDSLLSAFGHHQKNIDTAPQQIFF
jgi:hypothetical protein